MKSPMAAPSHPNGASAASRRLPRRLLGLAPAVLLVSGLLVVATGAPVALAAGGDWTQFHNDPAHQGYNTTETTLSASNVGALGVAWTATTGGAVYSSPAVANGVVYVGSYNGKVYAYAVGCASGGGTCTPLWTAATGAAVDSSPTVANGVVYVASWNGNLYAFDAAGVTGCTGSPKTCTPLWTATTGNHIFASPTVANGVVYVGSFDHKLYAFDAFGIAGCVGSPKTCTPLWTATTGGSISSSPAVANGVVYVGSDDAKLYAFDAFGATGCVGSPKTCTPLWTATTGGSIGSSSPAVANGVVYVGSGDAKLYAFDAFGVTGCVGSPKTCTPLWTATTGSAIESSPAVANGVVYVGSDDDKMYAFDAAGVTGCSGSPKICTPRWTATTGNDIRSSPAVANGVVYVGSYDAKVWAFDAAGVTGCSGSPGTCTPLWTGGTGNSIYSSPAVANGVVYVGSDDAKLYAFELNPLDHLVLSPANATVAAGGSETYTAAGSDAYSNSLGDVTGATTFTIGGGGSCTAASCTSNVPGDHTVTGTDGTATGTATLHVLAPWTQFHNDPAHQGYNTLETTLSASNVDALGVAWTGATTDAIYSSPAVANGVVYVASFDGRLAAYGVGCASGGGTCTPIWTAATGALTGSSPAVVNGVVYVGSYNGKVYAYAVGCASGGGTCTPLWTAATGAMINSSPAVAGGVAYVGSMDGKLYAFDAAGIVGCSGGPKTCTPIWTAATGAIGNSSPAIANGVVYVGSYDAQLYAFAAGCASGGGSCTPLWTGATTGAIDSSPAVANGVVYVGSQDGNLYAYAVGCSSGGGTCTPLWTATTLDSIRSSPAVADGVVYVGSNDHKLRAYAVGCASGGGSCTPLWTATTGAEISSSPAVANGVVYVGSDDHKLYAFAVGCASGGGTCTPLWTATTDLNVNSSPAVANGVVYVGSVDGKLYAYTLNPLHHLVLSPATATIAAGASQVYAAQGADVGGNSLGDVTSSTTFTISGGGSCTAASCTSTVPGDHTVTGTDGSATGTATLHVNAGAIHHLVLTPTSATIAAGTSQAYTAEGFDASNNGLGNVTSATTFTIAGGGSCTAASCTSVVPGDHTVTGTDGSATGTATLHVNAVNGVSGATYHAITPTRVLDTRNGTGGLSGPFTNHAARTFTVAGVPAGAIAVTGNLTVTGQTSNGYLFIGPVATNNPGSSTLNFPVGDDRANAVTVALSGTGTLSITFVAPSNGPSAHAIFDVTGYFTPDATGATYHALSPTRALDTRNGTGGLAGPFTNHVARTFTVSGVPAGAIAVTGNLTVTGQTSNGYLFIGPVATNNPSSSTLNFPVGDDRANAVTVALGAGGTLSITFVAPSNGPSAHAIFDVTGYFTADMTGAVYVPLTPNRVLDTRNGTGGLAGPFTNHAARTFTVAGVPAGAIAVTGNLTVTGQTSNGYLFIGPLATNNPGSSTLNFPVGDDRANAVTVALGTGTLSITFVAPSNGPTAHAIFDVTGYFVP